jgi:hypothetical protein
MIQELRLICGIVYNTDQEEAELWDGRGAAD